MRSLLRCCGSAQRDGYRGLLKGLLFRLDPANPSEFVRACGHRRLNVCTTGVTPYVALKLQPQRRTSVTPALSIATSVPGGHCNADLRLDHAGTSLMPSKAATARCG